jgi:hypothetical protein
MKCNKCGNEVTKLNHFYVPSPAVERKEGKRYCIKCAREEKIITLV